MGVQQELNAPKSLTNSFGGYKYRSCEGILEAVKPLLKKYGLVLTLNDEVLAIGDRYYIRATARMYDVDNASSFLESTALAREEESKKGMDASQISGTSSSYSRKYALCGLLAIDDNKDADALNTSDEYTQKPAAAKKTPKAATTPKTTAAPKAIDNRMEWPDKNWSLEAIFDRLYVNQKENKEPSALLLGSYKIDDEALKNTLEAYEQWKINNNLR